MEWTREDDEVVRRYMNAFYHEGFTIIDHAGNEFFDREEPDHIRHPKERVSINIVGRDH